MASHTEKLCFWNEKERYNFAYMLDFDDLIFSFMPGYQDVWDFVFLICWKNNDKKKLRCNYVTLMSLLSSSK